MYVENYRFIKTLKLTKLV